jgi:hypothetical protein
MYVCAEAGHIFHTDRSICEKVANSGKLISAAEDCITAAATKQRDDFNVALEQLYNAYQSINQSMETMWARSKPADYINFRCVGLYHMRMNPTKFHCRLQVIYLWYCSQRGNRISVFDSEK